VIKQTVETPDVPWGGKRTGAGRKTGPSGKRVLISARVDPSTAKKLRAEAKRRGVAIGYVIDELAKELPELLRENKNPS
jgi:hypothetical protein